MRSFESWMLSYLLNSLWQVPLLFAAGWAAARIARIAGNAAEHRVWVGVLLLQSLLPAGSALSWDSLRQSFDWSRTAERFREAHVSVEMGAGSPLGGLDLPSWLLTAIAIAYGATCLYFLLRFAWRCRRLAVLRRESVELSIAEDAADAWTHCLQRIGIADLPVATSAEVFGPVTLGIFKKLVLLPVSMAAGLPEAEVNAVLAHEFAHIQRNDFLKNLGYELLALPVSYHPLFWLTRERIMESREMICDQMAAELSDRDAYAHSLLRLASLLVEGMSIRIPHAIGIFDANTLERRLMRLTERRNEIRGWRRLGIAAACAVLGVGTCASALALEMHVDAVATDGADSVAKKAGPIAVSAKVMESQLLTKVAPIYPVEAKKERIQGKVVLNAVVGKGGSVENLTVGSGPKELQKSALDAVRQWTYKPFLLNGDPIDVKTTITVTYTLAK
ncbi:MAG: M56 family metallopeptidase [Terracidiphilus sp.]